MNITIPQKLIKAGLLRVVDDIPAGMCVDASRDFFRIFRTEIEAKLTLRVKTSREKNGKVDE